MIRIRPYKSCDAKYIIEWIKDEVAFRQWCADRYEKYPISPEDINLYYKNYEDDDNFFKMTALEDNEVIGHFIMRFTDEQKKVLRFGFIIVGDTKRGKGYGKKMLSLALNYAFENLKVEKVTLGVFENNPNAYYCYESLGFKAIQMEKIEYFNILNEQWKCVELEFMK
ncbi:MAG: GNAT family N-acetyltransferase [Clostridium sp.]